MFYKLSISKLYCYNNVSEKATQTSFQPPLVLMYTALRLELYSKSKNNDHLQKNATSAFIILQLWAVYKSILALSHG